MQRQIPPGRAFSCTPPTPAPILAALSVTCTVGLQSGQKKYESPRSTPVAAQPHASGPSSRGRPPVQSVRRPLLHLVAYGSTNKYRPVNSCKASGNTAKRPTLDVYFTST